MPVVVQDADRRFDVHPVLELLAAPNPGQGGAALFEGFYGYLLLSGDGYLEAAGEVASGGPRELYAAAVGPDEGGAGGGRVAGGLRVRGGRAEARLRHAAGAGAGAAREELPSAGRPLRAVAAGGGGERGRRAQLGRRPGRRRCSTMRRGRPVRSSTRARTGRGSSAADQYERLVDELETHHQGARNAGRPMLLEGGLDWKPMGFSPSDMEFHETKEAAARDDRARLRGAADAARAAGRQHLCELFRGATGRSTG